MEATGSFILRKELEWFRRDIDGPCWLVKDPVAMKFSRLEDEEKWILDRANEGLRSSQIIEGFPAAFPSQTLGREELLQFLKRCWQEGVIVADRAEQCSMVEQVMQHQRRAERVSVNSLLFTRIPLLNPIGLLTDLSAVLGWLFSRLVFSCWLLCAGIAAMMILSRRELFVAQVTDLPTLLSYQNLLALWLVFVVTKVIHELGHGISCHRYGGVCHEMGLFLFFLTPCLYCDVTDSWKFKSRRQRLVVALAGVYLESWTAILAAFVWWQSMPGSVVNIFAINVMLICSVSALVINMNPLLKFDGYFVLCDLLGIPNLRTRSFQLLKRILWPFSDQSEKLSTRRFLGLAVYAVAAIIYRIFMLAVIVWGLALMIENIGLGPLGLLLSSVLIGLIFGSIIMKSLRMNLVAALGAWLRVGCIAAIGGLIVSIPLPHYVSCDLIVVAQNAARVVVTEPGTLSQVYVREGQHVSQGDKLVQLSDSRLNDQFEQLRNRQALLRQQHRALLERATSDVSALDSLRTVESTLTTVNRQIHVLEQQRDQLTLVSPCQGVVYRVTPTQANEGQTEQQELETWQTSPLEPNNRGARFDRGTVVCQVGDEMCDLQLQIPERHFKQVATGMHVQCTIMSASNKPVKARIVQLARRDGSVEGSPAFIAVCRASHRDNDLLPGSSGVGRIRLGTKSIAQRVLDSLRVQWRSQVVVAQGVGR